MNLMKRISLIFTGILISLIILEIVLQIAGFTLTTIKKYQYKKINDPDAITILCLGESTTDGQWPPILQKILDKKAKYKKFKVIDEGHAAKNSEYLLYEIVNKKLSIYKPKIVVGMIGLNDDMSDKPYIVKDNTSFKLKIYKLIVLLKDHINKNNVKYLNKAALNDHINHKQIMIIEEIAQRSFNKNNNLKLLQIMKKIATNYPDIHYYEHITPALVNPYFNEIVLKNDKNYVFSIDDFTNYYKISDNYLELDKVFILFAKNFFTVKDYYNAVLCAKIALCYSPDSLISVKHILKMEKELNIKVVIKDNMLKKTKRVNTYSITQTIYSKITDAVFDSDAQFISMQYPTLPVFLLKEILHKSKYYNKIIFISNEQNFKEALQTHKPEDIFRDMFGKSFGHCTELGNTIIAENVAETILKLYDKE